MSWFKRHVSAKEGRNLPRMERFYPNYYNFEITELQGWKDGQKELEKVRNRKSDSN